VDNRLVILIFMILACVVGSIGAGLLRVRKRQRRYEKNPAFRRLVDTIIAMAGKEKSERDEKIRDTILKEGKFTRTEVREAVRLAKLFIAQQRWFSRPA
jgi:uncharacterized protein YneF (UPF0154 family)